MHALRRGQEVSITQPLQNFPLTYGRPGYVLAAGGIGITALVAMGRALRARGADYRFVYGARSRGLMAFVDELVAERGDRLELRIDNEGTRSTSTGLVTGVPDRRGAVRVRPHPDARRDQGARAKAGRRPAELRFGPSEQRAVRPGGVPGRNPRLGLETPVGPRRLDARGAGGVRRGHDVRLPARRVRAVSGQGRRGAGVVDHRDVFLSDAQHGRATGCSSCVSRVVSPRTGGLAGADGQQAAVTIDVPDEAVFAPTANRALWRGDMG